MKKTYIAPNATAVRLFAEEDLLTMSLSVSETEKNGTDALSNEKGSWNSSDWSSVDED
uniref:hypothetical protein n=1 Tax=Alloprevotella sp. TaxID=1872471 RepID=UPI004026AB56